MGGWDPLTAGLQADVVALGPEAAWWLLVHVILAAGIWFHRLMSV